MAPQWDLPRRPGHPAEPAPQPVQPIPGTPGPLPHGRPITRVDFFRRMPTGGATAYFEPTE